MNDELRVEFEPSHDPLKRDVRLRHAFETDTRGGRIRFETNSPTVLDILRACFEPDARVRAPDAVVHVMVVEGKDSPAAIRRFRLDRERVLVATPGSLGLGDARRAEGLLYVTPHLVRDRARFTAEFVAPIARAALGCAPGE